VKIPPVIKREKEINECKKKKKKEIK